MRLVLETWRYMWHWFPSLVVNSLAPGKFEWNFKYVHVIFRRILLIDGWGISCEIALIWMSLDFTDDQSTLVQVMAWCCQATSHYLSQCWPWALLPYGVTRPGWVKNMRCSLKMDKLTHCGLVMPYCDIHLCQQWQPYCLTSPSHYLNQSPFKISIKIPQGLMS